MMGKLDSNQTKTLREILTQAGVAARYQSRVDFLEDAKLQYLTNVLPMEEQVSIFVGALVRECERWGAPPSLGHRFATVLLAEALMEVEAITGNPAHVAKLHEIIAVYEPHRSFNTPSSSSSSSSTPLRILFLASNPTDWGKLSLEEELERVEKARHQAITTDPTISIQIQSHANVKDEEIIALIQNFQPHILHFAGHGDLEKVEHNLSSSPGKWRGLYLVDENNRYLDIQDEVKPSGIVVQTATGNGKRLPSQVLQTIFADPHTSKSIRLVVLNACWAQGQAELLVEKAGVPFAIGTSQPVNDKAAVRFAEGFYQRLFNRQSPLGSAFESGKNQILAVLGSGHETIPTLKVRGGLSAETYHIFDTL